MLRKHPVWTVYCKYPKLSYKFICTPQIHLDFLFNLSPEDIVTKMMWPLSIGRRDFFFL